MLMSSVFAPGHSYRAELANKLPPLLRRCVCKLSTHERTLTVEPCGTFTAMAYNLHHKAPAPIRSTKITCTPRQSRPRHYGGTVRARLASIETEIHR